MKPLKKALYKTLRPMVSVPNVQKYLKTITTSDHAALTERYYTSLVEFVRGNNPYYRQFSEAFPILTKEVIRENFDALKSTNVSAKQYTNSSGGSTGKPQTFLQDMEFSAWSEATHDYYYHAFLGVDPVAVKKVVLWGSERDTFKEKDLKGQVANWLTNTVFLNTFTATEKDWLRYIDTINAYKPHFVKGYAGSLYQIAKVSQAHNKPLFTPQFVYSSAETLQDYMRTTIEEAFGAKVFDYYGSREVGAIAGECKQGKKHIFTFNNMVEVVDAKNKPVNEGEVGKILITNLHNYSMPLIRYEIGDVGAVSHAPCTCGNPLPWFSDLKGRITDHFLLKDGSMVHGEYFTHLFYFRDWVDSFQVNQLDYDTVEVLVVTKGQANEHDQADITDKIKYVLGANTQVTWEFVPSIAPTPQGKHLFTRCLINP